MVFTYCTYSPSVKESSIMVHIKLIGDRQTFELVGDIHSKMTEDEENYMQHDIYSCYFAATNKPYMKFES